MVGRSNGASPVAGSQAWLDRVKAATIGNPTVEQFTRDHPIATEIGKAVAVATAETFIPGLATVNAAITLADEKASTFDKVMAVVTIATSVLFLTFNFFMMCLRCTFTVFSLILSLWAICLLAKP